MADVRPIEDHAEDPVHGMLKHARDVLKKSVREWLLARDETIAALEAIIALLHKTSMDVTISNTVGSSVSAVGGIIVIGGLIAAPFTFGASLIPTAIAGGVMAGVGGATAIGSSITGLVIDSNQVDQAQRCIEEDRSRLEILQKKIECYMEMYQFAMNLINEQTVHPQSGSYKALDADSAGPRLGCSGVRMAATAITGAVVGARVSALAVAHVFAAVGLGLDIAMIAFNAVKLGKGAKSDIGVKLEEAVEALKDERDQFKKEYLSDSER